MGADVQLLAVWRPKPADKPAHRIGLCQRSDPRAQHLADQPTQRLALPITDPEAVFDLPGDVS